MKNITMILISLLVSLQGYAQKEKMITAYWAANYQLTSYGAGIQMKSNIVDNFFIANNVIMFFNEEYEVNKMINLDANLQYVYTYPKNPKYKYYPFIGVGWANYRTEYYVDFYGKEHEDTETPVKGRYIFFNFGIGASVSPFEGASMNLEWKLATAHGRIHSTWLMGFGISF